MHVSIFYNGASKQARHTYLSRTLPVKILANIVAILQPKNFFSATSAQPTKLLICQAVFKFLRNIALDSLASHHRVVRSSVFQTTVLYIIHKSTMYFHSLLSYIV